MGFFDSVKKFGSDVVAVGQQVAGGVLDAGAAALNGVKTAITDPKKFIEDSARNVSEAARHVTGGIQDGASMIGEGWNEAWATGNPGMFLWKAVGGTAQMASLGTIHAFKEHVADVSTVKTDELGNMTGFDVSEDADAITRIFLENNGKTFSTVVNADNEVKEAIAEGDTKKANRVFGQMIDTTVVKPVSEAAAVAIPMAAGVAITAATGGAAGPAVLPLAAKVGLTGATVVSAANAVRAKGSGTTFDMENAADDVADQLDSDVGRLKAAGLLDEGMETTYREIMGTYYNNAVYTNQGESMAENYLGEGATNEDFRQALLQGYGLPDVKSLDGNAQGAVQGAGTVFEKAGRLDLSVPGGAAEAVVSAGVEPLTAAYRTGDINKAIESQGNAVPQDGSSQQFAAVMAILAANPGLAEAFVQRYDECVQQGTAPDYRSGQTGLESMVAVAHEERPAEAGVYTWVPTTEAEDEVVRKSMEQDSAKPGDIAFSFD